jgi:hypothetical protein
MKDHWEKFGKEFHSFKEDLEDLLDMLPRSATIYKQQNKLNSQFKKLTRALNDMDQFITPVKSVKVISPLLEDPEFPAAWKMWKDYLIEQHGIHLMSRAELMSLKRLADISDKKPKTAIEYLEYAMSRTDKNFYKVKDNELAVSSDEKTNGKLVVKTGTRFQRNIQQQIN